MDPQALLYYFGCIAVVCSLNAVFLFLACKQSRQAHCCPEYEHKYRGFKHGRLAVYVSLVLLQLGLSTARLFSHLTTDGLTWIDLSQLLVLLLYLSTLVRSESCLPSCLDSSAHVLYLFKACLSCYQRLHAYRTSSVSRFAS